MLVLDQVGTIISAGLEAGANQFGGVSFAPTGQDAALSRRAGRGDTRRAPEGRCHRDGRRYGRERDCRDYRGVRWHHPEPLATRAQFAERGFGGAVPIEAGEIVVQARVHVQFRLAA